MKFIPGSGCRRKKSKRNGSNAKTFINLWRAKYSDVVGSAYTVNWSLEGQVFKKLLYSYGPKKLRLLIDFAFSGHSTTDYLRRKGFPISLFRSCINSFLPVVMNPSYDIKASELEVDTPYYMDERTEYVWDKVCSGDINALIRNVSDSYGWKLLMAKMFIQDGSIHPKVYRFYKMWECGDTVKRRAITNGGQTAVGFW